MPPLPAFRRCHSHALRQLAIGCIVATNVASCGKQEATGQSVATVNGDPITQSELKFEIGALGAGQGDVSKAAPQVLQSLIARKLMAQHAKKDAIDKTSHFVLSERRVDEILLAQRELEFVQASKVPEPSATEVKSYIETHSALGTERSILSIDQIKFTPEHNPAEMEAIAATKTMDGLASVLLARGQAFERNTLEVDTATLPEKFYQKVLATEHGEPVIFLQGTVAIANSVINKRSIGRDATDVTAIAKQRIVAGMLRARLQQQQTALRGAAKIDFAPGFAPKG